MWRVRRREVGVSNDDKRIPFNVLTRRMTSDEQLAIATRMIGEVRDYSHNLTEVAHAALGLLKGAVSINKPLSPEACEHIVDMLEQALRGES